MIADLLKQIRSLPYADMMLVAKELTTMLPQTRGLNANLMAEALVQLSTMKLEDSIETQQEQKLLREMFRTKRTIAIKELNGGFDIQLSTLNGRMMHKDLKEGLSQMLDTMVAARALNGGK